MDLWEFIKEVFNTWVEKVGIILTLLPFIEKIPRVRDYLTDKPLIDRFLPSLWVIGIGCIFWGFYSAWAGQRDAAQEARRQLKEITAPELIVSVDGSTNMFSGQTTLLALVVAVLNRGADSVITECKVHFHSLTLDTDLRTVQLVGPVSGVMGNIELFLTNDDSILYKNRNSPITRGNQALGRVFVSVPGNRLGEMEQPETKITVRVKDYLGKWSEGTYVGIKGSQGANALPGEKAQEVQNKTKLP